MITYRILFNKLVQTYIVPTIRKYKQTKKITKHARPYSTNNMNKTTNELFIK